MARYYYLGPYTLDTSDPLEPIWRPPVGAIAALDLRHATGGVGFFVGAAPLTGPGLIPFGDGTDLREYQTTQAERDAWRSALNLVPAQLPDSITLLRDILVYTWERLGDPEHVLRFKPPTTTAAGNIELYLPGHSRISSTPFKTLPADARNRILRVHQAEVRKLYELCTLTPQQAKTLKIVPPDRDLYRRVLTDLQESTGVADYKDLVPADLRSKVLPPQPKETVHTESFDKENSSTLGPDLTWTETSGDFEVNNGQAKAVGTGGYAEARAEADVSSVNHYAQIVCAEVLNASNEEIRSAARFNAANRQHYMLRAAWVGASNIDLILGKRDAAAAYTTIATMDYATSISIGAVVKIVCDGSNIWAYVDGVAYGSSPYSDSSIAGNTRGGIHSRQSCRLDNYEIGDLGAAPTIVTPDAVAMPIVAPNPQLKATLNPPAAATPIVAPNPQLLITLKPTPAITWLTVPDIAVLVTGLILPDPVYLPLVVPSHRLVVRLTPSSAVIPLEVPSTQEIIWLKPEPAVLVLEVQVPWLIGASQLVSPDPVVLELRVPSGVLYLPWKFTVVPQEAVTFELTPGGEVVYTIAPGEAITHNLEEE